MSLGNEELWEGLRRGETPPTLSSWIYSFYYCRDSSYWQPEGIQTSYEVDLVYSVGKAEDGKWK